MVPMVLLVPGMTRTVRTYTCVRTQPGRPPWNPQTRTTTETVIREAMQALVRVQAHMRKLARIVVEIRSAGLAVELGL
jgi:hypothetical protein